MEHTVKKDKRNRIAMRSVATIFLAVAIARLLVVIMSHEQKSVFLTVFLCGGCFIYGLNLLISTLKPQAYDITYIFGDKTMTLKMHRKELTVHYDEIRDLGYVVPNDSLDYSLVQVYIGKEQYVIPFQGNRNIGEALYGMLKIKKEEAEESRKQSEED